MVTGCGTRGEGWGNGKAIAVLLARQGATVYGVDRDLDAAKVTRDARFKEDLEADSLDLVEFVMALEEEFSVEVPEKELEGITTVGQAFDLIAAKAK